MRNGVLAGLCASVCWLALPASAATYTVNRNDDIAPRTIASTCNAPASTDCTLREAIIKANSTVGVADTIVFAAGTNGTPITLSIVNVGGVNEDNSATGDLDVNDSLTITGNGTANTIVQAGTTTANGIDKVFAINPFCTGAVNFSMSGVTIRFGRNTQTYGAADFSYTGGGIDLCTNGASTMSLDNVVVTDNTNVTGYGGGINIDAGGGASTITITNTTVQNNKAASTGGGINIFGVDQTVTITNSTIQNNQTLATGGLGGTGGGINVRLTDGPMVANPSLTVNGTTISGNQSVGPGGGISMSGGVQNVTIQSNSTISGNTSLAAAAVSSLGGGVYAIGGGTSSITNTTITGNHADSVGSGGSPENPEGGGLLMDAGNLSLGAGVVISNNTAKDGAGIFLRAGGAATLTATGIAITGNAATNNGGAFGTGVGLSGGTATLTGSQVTGNSAGVSGGAFYVAIDTLTASKNRVAGNTAPTAAGLFRTSGTATITNNWWGCSSDPTLGGTPCNGVSGASATPWLRVLTTSGAATLVTNQTTGLTASVNTNSAGTDETGTVGVLLGQPVAWSAALGSISGAQTSIQPAGTATATFTATGAGAASAAAKVDGDGTSPVRFNVAQITVNKATTSVSLTGQGLATTVTGEPFSVSYSGITSQFGNSPTAPTGNVQVSDGVNSCTGTIAAGTCTITLFTAGARTLTATYLGDANFATSPASAGLAHTVNKADTTATITSDLPDPSIAGVAFPVTYTIAAVSPGSGTPTGTVTVSDGTTSCTGTPAAGTCNLTLTLAGAHSLTASFPGDANYNAAPTSASVSHQVDPGPATHFTVSAPGSTTAGTAFSITVTAYDAFNNVATGYTGTVHFTSNDGQAVLPANSTLTNGVGTFSATLKTAGSRTITATDTVTGSITGTSGSVTVSPAPASHFTVLPPGTATAGSPFTFTVTALDPYSNVATAYTGTVHFTKSDAGSGSAVPADYPFVGGDAGIRTFTNGATLVTAGSQTLTATDTVDGSITGTSAAIAVSPAAATHFTVSAPGGATAGLAFTVTVTARDQFDNTATAYAGTVHFTSSDGAATLPANSTLTSGAGTFSATLKTAGSQTVTATDTVTASITGTSGAITVGAAAATHFSISAPAGATAGTAFSFTVTALDVFNNTATAYAGTVHFTSTDGQAVLPANSTLTSGAGTFSATLETAGSRTITAADTVNASITGTSGAIAVSAAAAAHFAVTAPGSATAGVPFSITVTAQDAFNNPATGYLGTVHFTKSDAGAGSALPADYPFAPGDAGSRTFTNGATLVTAGSQTITATDTVNGSITGGASVTVGAAAATHLSIAAPGSVSAGSPFTFTVTALDQFNNTAAGYIGTVHFTKTDAAAGSSVPGDYAFAPADAGVHAFTNGATFLTTGSQTLTGTDTVTGSITGTSGTITVGPAGPAALSGLITGKSGPQNGRLWTITITNGGPGAALGLQIGSLTLTQTAGAACTPVVSSAFPLIVGNVSASASGNGAATVDFTGCAAAAQFKADFTFSANAGADTGSQTLYHQFE